MLPCCVLRVRAVLRVVRCCAFSVPLTGFIAASPPTGSCSTTTDQRRQSLAAWRQHSGRTSNIGGGGSTTKGVNRWPHGGRGTMKGVSLWQSGGGSARKGGASLSLTRAEVTVGQGYRNGRDHGLPRTHAVVGLRALKGGGNNGKGTALMAIDSGFACGLSLKSTEEQCFHRERRCKVDDKFSHCV